MPLIVLIIGAMALHNLIIWRCKLSERRRAHPAMVTRMTVNQRWQHLVLLTSFIILVITGFALKFPESWFAHVFGMGEHLRGIIHRIAGMALMAAGIYHVFYVIRCAKAAGCCAISRPVPPTRSMRSRPCATISASVRTSRNSGASIMPKRRNTGRWCGAPR